MRAVAISALVAGLMVSPFAIAAGNPGEGKATRHLTTDQAVSCIKQASASRPGRVTKMEIDVDNGRTICEVHFEDAKGKNFEAHVDVAANKVLRVKD